MIPFEEARSIVLQHAGPMPVTTVKLQELRGYCLARRVVATCALPRFDNSAVDGYGVRLADTAGASPESPVHLRVLATLPAGVHRSITLEAGTAVKIFTGGVVPRNADAVVMREEIEKAEGLVLQRPARPGENIRRKGEEFQKRDEVLPAGTPVTPAVIGILATFGYSAFRVYGKPRVAVIVTGDELVSPGKPIRRGQIYDSVSPSLAASLRNVGVTEVSMYRCKDTLNLLERRLAGLMKKADVILTTGGVSMGDYDFVKAACEAVGVKTHFWQVAIKPGKPNYFGTYKDVSRRTKLVFGLPGNPVSVLVSFHQFVRPALLKMMGRRDVLPSVFPATLTVEMRKTTKRLEFVRGQAVFRDGQWMAAPTRGQESHMLGGLAVANCFIHFPLESEHLPPGEQVIIEMIDQLH
ncbi:MAG TPA: gephyrin-like molybdotransferase Glp [Candidatus Deferrimicrobium sp.]|nr:gephyrin-like molybdotransferase Glp [Candidatus Deferrimicrobium sp.]